MGFDVECKQEVSGEKTSPSAMDTAAMDIGSKGSSIVATTENISTMEQGDASTHTAASIIAVKRADETRDTTMEPANKRIKLECETSTSITTASKDVTDKAIEASSDVVAKAPSPITTSTSIPIEDSSSGIPKPVAASASAGCDNVTTSATAVTEDSATTKPQHHVVPSIVNGQQQQSQDIPPPASTSICSTVSTKTTQNATEKVEASSSSSTNSQGGTSSVITASVQSSPQHTSQSSNTSADSSNGSLHDSETNPSAAAPAPPTTSRNSLPNSSREAAQPSMATTTLPEARSLTSRPPPTQTTNSNQKSPPLAVTNSAGTRTIPPPPKPVSSRTHVSSSTASSTTTVPSSNTNASSLNKEVPLKSLNYGHLRIKYLGELEYMLREFRKLERQLLGVGAKGAQQLEESVGSRERREKLHSFILHLEETIRQIETNDGSACSSGLVDSSSGTATSGTGHSAAEEATKQLAQESALSNLTKEKEEEETVQKLEEHILANLLPVKVRLKKQLAAQQGATQNPPGMPAMRRGTLQPSSTARGKGTFVEAVEKKRKHAESLRLAAQVQHERQVRSVSDPTQFGKPLSGVGSSLTKKLHGSTLGSKNRRTGHGVGSSIDAQERKILHAGMVPKSTQQKSGLSAASGAHEIIKSSVQSGNKSNNNKPATAALAASIAGNSTPSQTLQMSTKMTGKTKRTVTSKIETKATTAVTTIVTDVANQNKSAVTSSSAPLSEEDKLRHKKHRRLRKLKRLKRRRERELARQQSSKSQHQQQQQSSNSQSVSVPAAGRKKSSHAKVGQKKKGPRVVEYICSQCSEAYSSTCDYNPWWALAQHKCPKCGKTQIPRIDITSPANAIEYHPALLSHLEDGGRGGGSMSANAAQTVTTSMPIVSHIPDGANSINSESDSDLSELSDDNISIGTLKAAELESELQSMTPVERAEHETFGKEYKGPRLSDEHASKLLILMGHASTCKGQHRSEKHRDVCRSTKYMMLHVRDCPGTTSTDDVCPFPWCRKVKHLLYHLVAPDQCKICPPNDLPTGYRDLVGLNAHRMKKHRDRMISFAKASLAAKGSKPNSATKKQTMTRKTATVTPGNNTRKVLPDPKLSGAQQTPATQHPATVPTSVKPKVENVTVPAPYIVSTANDSSGGTGGNGNNHVQSSMVTETHPTVTQPSQQASADANDIINDFDINAEIAKLDEQLGSGDPGTHQTLQTELVPMKQEPETNVVLPVANTIDEANTVLCQATNFTTISEPEANDQVLPTPVEQIKLEDHDSDAAEISNFLAPSSSVEEHAGSTSMPEGDVGDVAEYLKNEYPLSTQHPQDAVVDTDHQVQIDMNSGVPGVDSLNDPNTDPLAHMEQDILMGASDAPHDILVPATASTNTCVELKQEYPEVATSTSLQPTPDVSAVTATSSDVEKTAGSVKVN